jgi:flagellar biosynthetic protein FliR
MDLGGALAGAGSAIDPHLFLGVFVLFCRIGGCLMLTPGFSSSQIPMQVRILIAIAATLSLTPLLLDKLPLKTLEDDPVTELRYIGTELLIGATIGMLGRVFFIALETMMVGAATLLGLSNPFGVEIEQNESLPPLATFIMMGATMLVFALDLHWEVLRGLVASYNALPPTGGFDASFSLRHIVDAMVDTFRIALRVCSPFVIYAVVVNLAVSIINRLTPQIAIFYIATPFIIGGGLLLLYFTIRSLLGAFMASFGSWLLLG